MSFGMSEEIDWTQEGDGAFVCRVVRSAPLLIPRRVSCAWSNDPTHNVTPICRTFPDASSHSSSSSHRCTLHLSLSSLCFLSRAAITLPMDTKTVDGKGITTTKTYRQKADGNIYQTITRTRQRTVDSRVAIEAMERQARMSLPENRFGAAVRCVRARARRGGAAQRRRSMSLALCPLSLSLSLCSP